MLIAGVDEAGRGPLAGPVTAAAVILPPRYDLPGLADSKAMSEKRREYLFEQIKNQAVAWAIESSQVWEIERFNILGASLLAMKRAVLALQTPADKALVDGNHGPELPIPVQCIIKGDASEPCISAASILAKVHRDRYMVAMEEKYPGYGFAKHKGYPTKAHLAALDELGICEIHRRDYGPVKKRLHMQNP